MLASVTVKIKSNALLFTTIIATVVLETNNIKICVSSHYRDVSLLTKRLERYIYRGDQHEDS